MKLKIIRNLLGLITFIILCFIIEGCFNDLDIDPKNVVKDEDLLSNPSDIDIYMSRMYSLMPFEDFKYNAQWGLNRNGWLISLGISGTGEAVNREGLSTAFTGEDTPYWGEAYKLIHDANHLIKKLPDFRDGFTEEEFDHYIGEAYYIRATAFYAMARRYGGVPLAVTEQEYTPVSDSLEIPRSSEKDTWDQILHDFDKAIELMKEDSPKRGYSNKYVALAFKSEAMLYAGSIAKYNENVSGRLTGIGDKTGIRVIGFSSEEWRDASIHYFSESFAAANEIIQSGKYSLYKKKWAADDGEAQYQNMVDMFMDSDSPENIYVKEFDYPTMTHGFDAYNVPFSWRNPLSAETCPTFDFINLFDGFDRYSNGDIKTTSGADYNDGDYLLFDSTMEFFKDVEPRLRAYVLLPGDEFRDDVVEVRAGTYTGVSPISPFFSDYGYNSTFDNYQNLDIYNDEDKSLYLSPRENDSQELVEYQGGTMTAAGKDGPFYDNPEATITGLYIRKYLNDNGSARTGEGKSDQHFILMRYGEVLLNAAEAAVELELFGESAPDGSNLSEVATNSINKIRERAGANLLTKPLSGDIESRNIVRKERLKELAFEKKNKWAKRRWRVLDYDNREGFWGIEKDKNKFSDGDNYRFRGIYPFFSTEEGKYFFDVKFQWISTKTYSYKPLDYYFGIPSNEVSKSSVIDQQPNR